MNKPFIVGNWKMNTSCEEAVALAQAVASTVDQVGSAVDVGICPPFPWIVPARQAIGASKLQIGAQDCAATTDGAHTGDVSASMLSSCCTFTLIGHSERRQQHQESDALLRQKADHAFHANLGVILCVGETDDERNAGTAAQVVQRQLDAVLEGLDDARVPHLTIAYEPVWAIGTGVAATANDAAEMAGLIRTNLVSRFGPTAHTVRILYGGSANDSNAAAFLAAKNVDGLLIGGASLSSKTFGSMIQSAVNRG